MAKKNSAPESRSFMVRSRGRALRRSGAPAGRLRIARRFNPGIANNNRSPASRLRKNLQFARSSGGHDFKSCR